MLSGGENRVVTQSGEAAASDLEAAGVWLAVPSEATAP